MTGEINHDEAGRRARASQPPVDRDSPARLALRADEPARRRRAMVLGYFFLPCPICGIRFSGEEWGRDSLGLPSSIPTGPYSGAGICPPCTAEGRGHEAGSEPAINRWPEDDARPARPEPRGLNLLRRESATAPGTHRHAVSLGLRVGYWPCHGGPFVSAELGRRRYDAWWGTASTEDNGAIGPMGPRAGWHNSPIPLREWLAHPLFWVVDSWGYRIAERDADGLPISRRPVWWNLAGRRRARAWDEGGHDPLYDALLREMTRDMTGDEKGDR